jgi:hypothetical protein
MNRLSPFAAVALIVLSGTAAAQTPSEGQGRIEIVGQAPNACVIRGQGNVTTVNGTYASNGLSSGELRIVEMVDSTTARGRAVSLDLALDVVCNSPHRLMLRSTNGGLLRRGAPAGAPASGPFVQLVPYSFSASWLGHDVTSQSDSRGLMMIEAAAAGAGQYSLGIRVPGGEPLVAGTYEDSVVLEFSAVD